MLFHIGALWRINELGYLPNLSCVASVSGGAVCAGVLALAWQRLTFDADGVASNFMAEVVEPLRGLAGHTIDALAIGARRRRRGWGRRLSTA
jgi:NTE family protein